MKPKIASLVSKDALKENAFIRNSKRIALKQQGLPETEATEDAQYAQKRLAIANKYSNKKNRAKAEAKYGKKAKETRKIKYAMKDGRYVRAESQD